MEAANDNGRCCPQCGGAVDGKKGKVYCSATCKRRARAEREGPYDPDRRLTHIECVCEGCKETFNPKHRNRLRFCSRECFFASIAENAERRSQSQPEITQREKFLAAIKFAQCKHCASDFVTGSYRVVFCSDICRSEAARIKSRDAWRAMSQDLANDNELKPARDCAECGCEFTPTYGDKRSVFCSAGCSKRSARRTARKAARALLKSVTVERVNPTKVFDRDGWSCMQCGVSTPRELRGTYKPNAPELDHIVPLSKGGEHSYANTQCLCRRCNAMKSDTMPVAA